MQNLNHYILELTSEAYALVLIVLIISMISYVITRYGIVKLILRLFEKTSNKIDDVLIQRGFLNRISYAVPLVIIYNLMDSIIGDYLIINRILLSLMAVVFVSCLNALLNAINDIYNQSKYSSSVNIKSYVQVLKLFINLFGVIVIVSILSGKSPFYLLSGIGALTAVLMLVFKDTILSFVSSI